MAEAADSRKALIAALGNTLMGDDGAGVAVLEELRRRGAARQARLCEAGGGGVDLLAEMDGVDMLVIVDAMVGSAEPGEVRVLQEEDLLEYAERRGGGSHQPSLADTLRLARQLGLAPRQVWLVGIAARQFDLGAGLSPEVAAAVPRAAGAVEQILAGGAPECC